MVEDLFQNLHLQLSKEDIRKVDEWKIAHGMRSRTEAIRSMVRIITSANPVEIPSGFLEDNKSNFMKPVGPLKNNSKNESLEETIRKVVKEELSKILDKEK